MVVLDILKGAPLPEGLNDTFLTLIPKIAHPQQVSQFRPIGLCNVIYKLVTKILVQRLKRILPELISPYQSSFVPRRQISDNIVIMQELLHTMRKKRGKVGLMAIKLDLEKAYDRLNWKFIENTLHDMRLPQSLVDVIMRCITTCSMRVLWNGEPTDCFNPSRGIRQGDPLSPHIFVACVERLSQLIEDMVHARQWRPIRICQNGPSISRLLFADDIVLFAEATESQARLIQGCLDRFCTASGQKISAAKSRVFFSPNTEDLEVGRICNVLGMEATTDLGKYLGVPTLHGRSTRAQFQYVLERIDNRLAGWKTSCLSLAGRTTLIQSTIEAIPSYTMQTIKLPRSLCDDIDRKIRRFLWGGTASTRKIHLAHWNIITKPRDMGGLGIRSMRQLNSAQLAKLGWRVITESESLWSRVLRTKYCKGRASLEAFSVKPTDSLIWRGIVEQVEVLRKGLGIAVGDGRNTQFWTHKWAGDSVLADLAIRQPPSTDLPKLVRDYWEVGRGWKWDLLSPLLPEAALATIASFELADDTKFQDQIFWRGTHSGCFSLKSAMLFLRNEDGVEKEAHWTRLWKLKAPQRLKMFAWLALHDKLMTNWNRTRRGLTDDPFCIVCDSAYEDIEHVLRSCPKAKEVWRFFARLKLGTRAYDADFRSWFIANLTDMQQDGTWPTKFLIILWFLWK